MTDSTRTSEHPGAKSLDTLACKPVQSTGTVSKSSWGETSSIYPTKENLYDPSKWDQAKACELRKMRAAVHDVCKRNPDHHESSPKPGDALEQKISVYHLVENFPPLDKEITPDVKWFYLSPNSVVAVHPGTPKTTCVRTYGPFFNAGGGDVPKGVVYVHFYKLA